MLGFDSRPVDERALKKDRETYLKDIARENTQLVINAMWEVGYAITDMLVVLICLRSRSPYPSSAASPFTC